MALAIDNRLAEIKRPRIDQQLIEFLLDGRLLVLTDAQTADLTQTLLADPASYEGAGGKLDARKVQQLVRSKGFTR